MYERPDVPLQGMPQDPQSGAHKLRPRSTRLKMLYSDSLGQKVAVRIWKVVVGSQNHRSYMELLGLDFKINSRYKKPLTERKSIWCWLYS